MKFGQFQSGRTKVNVKNYTQVPMAKMLKIKEEKRYIAFSAAPIRLKLIFQ